MIKISAPSVFDGEKFLCENSVVALDERGFVCHIDQHPTHWDGVQRWEGGIIAPAFVNVHCHLELSHLKGIIPQHTGMAGFIQGVIQSPPVTAEEMQYAADQADEVMWRAGIQAVGDICNTARTLSTKTRSRIRYHSFIELLERAVAGGDTLQRGKELRRLFAEHSQEASLTPHAPYTVSPALWRDILTEVTTDRPLITIHYNESPAEKQLLQHSSGELFALLSRLHQGRPIPHLPYNHWMNELPNGSRLCLVHGTYSTREDWDWIEGIQQEKSLDITHCICIRANRYIHDAVPPLGDMVAKSLNWCIGTDSLSSNDTLSVLEELKTIHQHFPDIAVEQLLKSATSVGAKTLGVGDRLGKLECGYRSGLVHISHADKDGLSSQSQVSRLV